MDKMSANWDDWKCTKCGENIPAGVLHVCPLDIEESIESIIETLARIEGLLKGEDG